VDAALEVFEALFEIFVEGGGEGVTAAAEVDLVVGIKPDGNARPREQPDADRAYPPMFLALRHSSPGHAQLIVPGSGQGLMDARRKGTALPSFRMLGDAVTVQHGKRVTCQINRAGRPPAGENGSGGGVLFQVSTLDGLLQGLYNGSFTIRQLKQFGNFGLGTYEGLDGEMIVVDGHFYHMRANGVLSEAADEEVAPFAVLTRFQPETQFTVAAMTIADLSNLIDTLLPSKNYFYAIRIHGTFSAMSTRAIPM
jgi:hypothetical protein